VGLVNVLTKKPFKIKGLAAGGSMWGSQTQAGAVANDSHYHSQKRF